MNDGELLSIYFRRACHITYGADGAKQTQQRARGIRKSEGLGSQIANFIAGDGRGLKRYF